MAVLSVAGDPPNGAPAPLRAGVMFHCIVQPRHDWGPPDLDNAFPDIKLQLAEQTRVLEARAEATAGVAGELSDYCRRRADLEHEYARALDKLAKAAHQKHKDQRHKREQWTLTGAYSCWQAALENTRSLSRDHAALAELYGGPLSARLQRAADDALRLHRKCRDIVYERHEEIGAALGEAAAAAKAHAAAAGEWRAAALKLRHAHTQRAKIAETPRQKKLKAIDKELEKRRTRHSEARAKALRARADYMLSLEAANATLQRYYLDDIADIMLCMEVGFEAVVGRTVRTAGAGEAACGEAGARAAGALLAAADTLDSLHDRQRFVCAHAQAFAPPRPLPYRPPPPESQDLEMRELLDGAAEEEDEGAAAVLAELAQRLQQLEAGARQLRAECRENAKTLDAAEAELVRQMEGSEIDVSSLFGGASTPAALPAAAAPDDEASKKDQEDYYLAKFRSYVSCAGRLARLESKAAVVRSRLLGAGPDSGRTSPPTPARRAALRRGLFAAPLDDSLPAVLRSCVRVIASYGVRHQGIFRVSGSQVEMQALRAAFERGEDPLARVRDASDINSVCGLLKLYLRELRPPLVPAAVSEQLLRVAATQDGDIVKRLRQVMATLPSANMIVLRYLTAFLAHLTEYSEQNMMDAWNLAICLGPTLMAARGEGGAQVTAQNLVNELVKRIIIHHAEIFPQDVAPHTLYVQYPEAQPNSEVDAVHEADGEAADDADDNDANEDDIRDDLSLYADDDDEISEDGESGEWRERDSVPHHNRSTSADRPLATPQVRELANASPVAVSALQCRRLAETTPDLVLDLPARAELITPADAPAESASTSTPPPAAAAAPPPASSAPSTPSPADGTPVDTADTFVHNRDTLKKRPAHKHSNSDGSGDNRSEGEASNDIAPDAERTETNSGASGSPVPARNTARVAAKFADLTLTGGSLKPALAAKPALLRRPTPHPQHARPSAATSGPVNPPSDSTC